jgi:hypothetical protein
MTLYMPSEFGNKIGIDTLFLKITKKEKNE